MDSQLDDEDDPTTQSEGSESNDVRSGSEESSNGFTDPINHVEITEVSGRVDFAGRDKYTINYNIIGKQAVKLGRLLPDDLSKIQAVYVQPINYAEAKLKLITNRLLILIGDEHVGKFATALSLALELQHDHYNPYVLGFSDDASLASFLDEAESPSNSVFLVKDAFVVPGLSSVEFQRYIGHISDLLNEKNSYVVLTSDSNVIDSTILVEDYMTRLGSMDRGRLLDVLERHKRYYGISHSTNGGEIINRLSDAYSIDLFAKKLATYETVNTDVVNSLLDTITNVRVETQRWFSGLEFHERLYAMLVALCPELDKDILWDVYVQMVSVLRKRGVEVKNPLNYSQGELWMRARVRITELDLLEFETPVQLEYVLNQARFFYQQQFRVLLPTFAQLVIQHEDNRQLEFREVRIALASAVGELGKSIWKHIEGSCIKPWSIHRNATIRACTAYALRQMATESESWGNITGLLYNWKNNSDSLLRWSASAASERLYPYMPDKVLPIFTDLAKDSNRYVRKAVAHALTGITRRNFEDAFGIIEDWVLGENQRRRATAAETFKSILEETSGGSRIFRTSQAKIRAIPFFIELCRLSEEDLDFAMDGIYAWLLRDGNSEFQGLLEKELVELCETSGQPLRRDIVNRLENWANGDNETIYRLAVVLKDQILHLPEPVPSPAAQTDLDQGENNGDFIWLEELPRDPRPGQDSSGQGTSRRSPSSNPEDDSDFQIQRVW
jgi:hypothetical protein